MPTRPICARVPSEPGWWALVLRWPETPGAPKLTMVPIREWGLRPGEEWVPVIDAAPLAGIVEVFDGIDTPEVALARAREWRAGAVARWVRGVSAEMEIVVSGVMPPESART